MMKMIKNWFYNRWLRLQTNPKVRKAQRMYYQKHKFWRD